MSETASTSYVDSAILKHEKDASKRSTDQEKRNQDIRHATTNKQDLYNKEQDAKIEENHDDIVSLRNEIDKDGVDKGYMKAFLEEIKKDIKVLKDVQNTTGNKVRVATTVVAILSTVGSFVSQIYF